MRNLLGRLGDGSFSESDWRRIVSEFGDACAYCGAKGALSRDHIVPINAKSLGEHRLGNLAPCCGSCNQRKRDLDYRDFLAQDPEALTRIEAHMARHGYHPKTGNAELRRLVEEAHEEVRALADRWATRLNEVIAAQG